MVVCSCSPSPLEERKFKATLADKISPYPQTNKQKAWGKEMLAKIQVWGPLRIVGENVQGYNHCGKHYRSYPQIKDRIII